MTILIKKYANRRLYDTQHSTYVTLDDLADLLAQGHDLKVVDLGSGDDLTQSTLAQILLETRQITSLIHADVLTSLLRMDPDALARFFGPHLSWALGLYPHPDPQASATPQLADLSRDLQELKALVLKALTPPSPPSDP